jgi:hypothetical protein
VRQLRPKPIVGHHIDQQMPLLNELITEPFGASTSSTAKLATTGHILTLVPFFFPFGGPHVDQRHAQKSDRVFRFLSFKVRNSSVSIVESTFNIAILTVPLLGFRQASIAPSSELPASPRPPSCSPGQHQLFHSASWPVSRNSPTKGAWFNSAAKIVPPAALPRNTGTRKRKT